MAKAEVGSAKYVANKLKAKGLQRLRWYCQVCQKQCRDENGFKCHTQSESHLKNMLKVGKPGGPNIEEFSRQFKADFVHLLRSSHGEKPIGANRFYNEYIQNKDHVHMNATRWSSLAAFCNYLGHEGICKVDSTEEGLVIAWIDTSLDAKQRRQQMAAEQQLDESRASSRALKMQMKAAVPVSPASAPKHASEHAPEPTPESASAVSEPAPETGPVSFKMKSMKPKVERKRSVFSDAKRKSPSIR